jgi:hypothetical protein
MMRIRLVETMILPTPIAVFGGGNVIRIEIK